MSSRQNPVWAELVQLIPVISFALPFIVAGHVDLGRAGPGFFIGAALFLLVSVVVRTKKHLLNPILVGTGIWLCLGALAFGLHIGWLVARLAALQGFALFVCAFVVGVAATLKSPHGYIGGRGGAPSILRASFVLLVLTVLVLIWSWLFRMDVRLGGGLPFIVLNVARRVLIRRML